MFGQDRDISSLENVYKLVEYVRREAHNLETNTQPLLEKGFVAWGPPPIFSTKKMDPNTVESSGEKVEKAVDQTTPAIWVHTFVNKRISMPLVTIAQFYFLMLLFSSRYLEKYSVDLFMWYHSRLLTTSVSRLFGLSRIVFSTKDRSFG